MATSTIAVTGADLTPENVAYAAHHPSSVTITVPEWVYARARSSRDVLENAMGEEVIYGVNTGFGPMADRIIAREDLQELQYNLVRSHAAGVGQPIATQFVRAAMLVRLNTLARGDSGVTPELIGHLCACLNADIIPLVPEHGAVGTSGDLLQLAHIALGLIGEGNVWYGGAVQTAAEALTDAGLHPYHLQPKEGLALINGTAVMTGIAAIAAVDTQRLLQTGVRATALANELCGAHADALSATLHAARGQPGQERVAAILRTLLTDSNQIQYRYSEHTEPRVTETLQTLSKPIQNVYSLRCAPQVLGPMFESLDVAHGTIQRELNASTDNPLVDTQDETFLHGGNFHGDYIACTVDTLKQHMTKLSLLSERRTNFFCNSAANGYWPPFLNANQPGLTLGLQGLQFAATSTAADNQSLAYPHSVHSISTNGDNQDVVSMGTDAALFATKVIANTRYVLAIELSMLSQAAYTSKEKETSFSHHSQQLLHSIRTYLPPTVSDRSLSQEVEHLVTAMQNDPAFAVPTECMT